MQLKYGKNVFDFVAVMHLLDSLQQCFRLIFSTYYGQLNRFIHGGVGLGSREVLRFVSDDM